MNLGRSNNGMRHRGMLWNSLHSEMQRVLMIYDDLLYSLQFSANCG